MHVDRKSSCNKTSDCLSEICAILDKVQLLRQRKGSWSKKGMKGIFSRCNKIIFCDSIMVAVCHNIFVQTQELCHTRIISGASCRH